MSKIDLLKVNDPKGELPHSFYKYYDFDNVYYCGARSFPCGSVAGTPGYMCAKQLIKTNS